MTPSERQTGRLWTLKQLQDFVNTALTLNLKAAVWTEKNRSRFWRRSVDLLATGQPLNSRTAAVMGLIPTQYYRGTNIQ